MTAHEPRLLVYSQDGLGLGHMRRTSALASEFLHRLPGSSALTLSDSPLGQFFSTATGHDYLKLPSIRKAGPENWEAVSLQSSLRDVLAMRSELIASAISAFDPQVLLVDHMPHGALGELVPALRKVSNPSMKVVLGLRDILDDPDVIQRRWTTEGAYEAVEEFYDEVLVYGSQHVFDIAEQYAWPEAVADKLTYCGYVCAPPARVPRSVSSQHLKLADGDPLVLVMAGGGADAYPMFASILESASAVHAATGAQFLMVTGPFMPEPEVKALKRRARGLPVSLTTTVADSPTYMASADLVVAMAGYNTTIELLNTGTPALLVPRTGPSAEQRTRAHLFADRGWCRWIDPDHLDTDLVTDAVITGLTVSLEAPVSPDLRGRENAVEHLLRLLESDSWRDELETVAT